jgi:hypothetical protein
LPNRFRSSISWPSSSPAVATTPNSFENAISPSSLSLYLENPLAFVSKDEFNSSEKDILFYMPSQENICDTFALMPSPAYLNRLRMDEKCLLLRHYCIFIFPLKLNSMTR